MELADFWGLLCMPVLVGLVEVAKLYTDDKRLYPLIAMGCGIIINAAIAYRLEYDYLLATLLGIAAGLAASGLYSGVKAIRGQ